MLNSLRIKSLSRSRHTISPTTCMFNLLQTCSFSTIAESPPKSSDADLDVTFEEISRALHRIRSGIVHTSCDFSHLLSEHCGSNIYLKKEFSQFTGSFKERGARNALMLLPPSVKKTGVITASAGNHALALAYHGKLLGVPVTCVMPRVAPLAKIEKCRKMGAVIEIQGSHIGESREFALSDPRFKHLKYINGFNDADIIAGAGTMALEIMEQVPNTDIIVIPVGGAGLIAGVSLAIKTLRPDIKVVGVEPALCPSFFEALKAGKPVNAFKDTTLADGLAVPIVGDRSFNIAKRFVDVSIKVTERQIALAMLRLIEMEKMIVEGGGAAGLAALLPNSPLGKSNLDTLTMDLNAEDSGLAGDLDDTDVIQYLQSGSDPIDISGKNVVVALCGGNIDTPVLGRVIDRGLAADNRLVKCVVTVSDRPGGIARLTHEFADVGVSIKDIYHERAWLHANVDQVQVKVVVETFGLDHTAKLKKRLEEKGYKVSWSLGFHHVH